MVDKKILLTVIPLFVIALLGAFAFSNYVKSTEQNVAKFIYKSDVCISTTGDFEGRKTSPFQGEFEIVECGNNPNLVTNAGLNAIRDTIGQGTNFSAFESIGLCNATAGCGSPAAGDTTLENEFTSCGLSRAAGTYGTLGTGNWSIFNTFTATCDNRITNKTGIFNHTSSGTLFAENTFTLVTLQTNDQLTVNWTIQVVNG
jgi:hypothetical protein